MTGLSAAVLHPAQAGKSQQKPGAFNLNTGDLAKNGARRLVTPGPRGGQVEAGGVPPSFGT